MGNDYDTAIITTREYPGGVIAVDSGMLRREFVACYLLEAGHRLALIEVGCNASVPRILTVVRRRGWRLEDVSHVIVTHVHLDHAGGAGRLMDALPNATLVVHPRGARHMVDPERLEAGTRAVYGDAEFEATYGRLVPVPRQRVREMEDNDTLAVGNRELLFVDTPGHAKHHFCVWDRQTQSWFTGDTFGISYRDLDTDKGAFIFPTTTPVQFEPEALISSVERLMEYAPEYMYLTHFGRVGDTQRLARQMTARVRKLAEIAERYRGSATRSADIARDMQTWLLAEIRTHGVRLPEDRVIIVDANLDIARRP